MSKPTPTPWLKDEVMGEPYLDVIMGVDPPGAGSPNIIASFVYDEDGPIGIDEARANRRLFMAAPDLLDAAKFAFAAIQHEANRPPALGHTNWPMIRDILAAAIARAEGDQP